MVGSGDLFDVKTHIDYTVRSETNMGIESNHHSGIFWPLAQ